MKKSIKSNIFYKKIVYWLSISLLSVVLPFAVFANEKIRLTNGEWPPYLSENLAHYGYASHIISEAFLSVNVDVEYGFFPWKRSLEYAKFGQLFTDNWNGSVVWVHTNERTTDFIYTDVVITDELILFSLKSNPLNWKSINDLQGKKIGGTLHTSYPLLEQANKEGIIYLNRASNYEALFKRLLMKRIDAIPYTRDVARYFIKNNLSVEQREQIIFSPTVIETRQYHIILSKNISENNRFKDLFNQGLKNIKANGTYDKIQDNLEKGVYDHPINRNK